jgi:hypothetical protein
VSAGYSLRDVGQYVLRFRVESLGGRLTFLVVPTPSPAVSDDDLFDKPSATEETNPVASVELYRQALAVNPKHVGAYMNLGRALLCEAAGLKQEAIRHLSAYRRRSKR